MYTVLHGYGTDSTVGSRGASGRPERRLEASGDRGTQFSYDGIMEVSSFCELHGTDTSVRSGVRAVCASLSWPVASKVDDYARVRLGTT